MDGYARVPAPINEPVRTYAPGSPERTSLQSALAEMASHQHELPMVINGERRAAGGAEFAVVQPHKHAHVLGVSRHATHDDARSAIAAAKQAAPGWAGLSFQDRSAVLLRAADLLAGPWRNRVLAATMLGQSKTCFQAEIDAACELIDFWRYNVYFAERILSEQPFNSPGVWNRSDHRPLEGFVYAITPFNFTAIAANIPTAPALMGNTVVWKPAPTQMLSATITMQVLEAAGLPAGVINLVPGDGIAVSEVALADPDLAGIHFTGSTAVFQHLWRTVGANIANYRSYPRLVGETGGKDFVLAHPSADVGVLRTALIRGAFEYQGQKCSAASRAYVPKSVWARMRDSLVSETESITMGDVSNFSNFMGAVIDAKSFARLKDVIDRAHQDPAIEIITGGTYDDSVGYFVKPTIVVCADAKHEVFTREFFGPFLAIHVFDDSDYDAVMVQMESVAPYALTGSIIAQDQAAIAKASEVLRFAAGNFYINDKPTGAVVGQQPFGGGRASGTNDKAGAAQNLMRWTSTRSIKETLVPPTDYRYPHLG